MNDQLHQFRFWGRNTRHEAWWEAQNNYSSRTWTSCESHMPNHSFFLIFFLAKNPVGLETPNFFRRHNLTQGTLRIFPPIRKGPLALNNNTHTHPPHHHQHRGHGFWWPILPLEGPYCGQEIPLSFPFWMIVTVQVCPLNMDCGL